MPSAMPDWKRQHELMDEMMLRVGIDSLAAVNRGGFVKARSACRSCQDHPACKEWLLVDADILRDPPGFCPNFSFFAAIKRG